MDLSLVLSQALWRQGEVHDGVEAPRDKVEESGVDVGDKDAVEVRVCAVAGEDAVPLILQELHSGDSTEMVSTEAHASEKLEKVQVIRPEFPWHLSLMVVW